MSLPLHPSISSNELQNLFHFFIYTDSGSCLYKLSSEKDKDKEFDKSIQGILQALYFTSTDVNSELKLLTCDYGLLSYKSFKQENTDNSLLFALILPNTFGDEDLALMISHRILDYIYYCLVMHIGIIDFYTFSSNIQIDSLKKLIDLYEPSICYILNNYQSLPLLLQSEKRLEVKNEVLYPIRHYLENMKNSLKISFMSFYVNDSLVWNNIDWGNLDIVDKLLFQILSKLYSESDISEIPFYFSKTPLEYNSTGKTPYKLFTIDLLSSNTISAKLVLISDCSMTIKQIYDSFNSKIFDEFFLSRLISFNYSIQLNNIIDTTVKSLLVINSKNKTYKMMIDETSESEEIFQNFILNTHFSNNLFENENSSSGMLCDEYYVKGESFTYYYYNFGDLIFLILMDKDTNFDDINTVKVTIKTFKEKFEEKVED